MKGEAASWVNEKLEEEVRRGQLVRGASPWGSPPFPTREAPSHKKHRKRRLVVDYRRVNSRVVRSTYYCRRASDVVSSASGSVWYSFVDAVTGFNQIKNTRRAMEVLAIVARSGKFLPVCLTFGPVNGPDDFCFVVDRAYAPGRGRKLRYTREWVAYVDDLTVRTGRVVDGRYLTDDQAEAEVRAACKKGPVEAVQPTEEALKALGVGLGPEGSKADQVPKKNKHDEVMSDHNHPTRKGSCHMMKLKLVLFKLWIQRLWDCGLQVFHGSDRCYLSKEVPPEALNKVWLANEEGVYINLVADFDQAEGVLKLLGEEEEDSPRGADAGEAAELPGDDTESSSDVEVGRPIPSAPSGINAPKESPAPVKTEPEALATAKAKPDGSQKEDSSSSESSSASPKAKSKGRHEPSSSSSEEDDGQPASAAPRAMPEVEAAPKAKESAEAPVVPEAKVSSAPKGSAEPSERAVVKPPVGKVARKSASKPKVQPKGTPRPVVGNDAARNPKRVLKVYGRALKLHWEIIQLAEEWASQNPCSARTMESPFQVRSIAAKRLVQKRRLRGSVAQSEIRKMFRLLNQDGTGDIEQACSSCDERTRAQAGPVVEYIRRHGLKGSGPRTRPHAGPEGPQRSRRLRILKSSTLKRKAGRAAGKPAPSTFEEEVDFGDSPAKEESPEEDQDLRGEGTRRKRRRVRVSDLGRTALRESSFRLILRSVAREMPLVLKENRDRPVSPEKGPLTLKENPDQYDGPVAVVHPKKHPWGSWVCEHCREVNGPEETVCTTCGDDFHNSTEWADDLNATVKRKAKAREKERHASSGASLESGTLVLHQVRQR